MFYWVINKKNTEICPSLHALAKITTNLKIHCISEKAVNREVRKSSTKFVSFVKTAKWKKMENFGKIQKFAEECKAVKEEVERASTKPAILVKLAKNWANMRYIISKLLHVSVLQLG